MKHTLLVLALLAGAAHATQPIVGGAGIGNNNTGGNAAQSQSAISNSFSAGGAANATNYGSTATATAGQGGAGGSINAAGGIGNTTFERSAPSVGVSAPIQVRNCRTGIGFGGSNANGSAAFAIPLGNDTTCLAGAALEAMAAAGGFTVEEKQAVACTIEGMEKIATCKRLTQEANKDVSDPYIRHRMGLQ